MSPKQWLALMLFYTAYLFFGASIFYHTEHAHETDRRAVELQERIEINELLMKHAAPHDEKLQLEIIQDLNVYCKRPVSNYTFDEYEKPHDWTFYHSVFFAFTVCSTLGYGNIAPTDTFGRYFMIFYALIGMPVNAILYTYLGEFFGKTFLGISDRYKAYKLANNKNYVPRRLGMIAQITLYLLPAAVLLVFLPSLLFTYFEGWPYEVSVYYSFVTLSTIGFGDFIPTFQPHQEREFGVYFQLYEAFVIIWFVFGLSYLLMLVGFIANGMRSKRIIRLEHQLSENIKITQNRIWSGVTKDVSYLRRILNEISLLKVKPVYMEEDEVPYPTLQRSLSCPAYFEIYRPAPIFPTEARKRAYSENFTFSPETGRLIMAPSRHSENDLSRINKQLTFQAASNQALLNTGDVLSRVVQALTNITTIDPSDVVDNTMKHSHHNLPTFTFDANSSGSPTPPIKPRVRAVSEYRVPNLEHSSSDHEWTWNGTNAQIQEFQRLRAEAKKNSADNLFRQVVTPSILLNGNHSCTVNLEEPPLSKPVAESVNKSFLRKINPFKKGASADDKRYSVIGIDPDVKNYLDATMNGRGSRRPSRRESNASMANQYLAQTARGRPSLFDNAGIGTTDQNILENTTIADLIRAIEIAHTQENIPNKVMQEYFDSPPVSSLSAKTKIPSSRRASMFPMTSFAPEISLNPSNRNSVRRPSFVPGIGMNNLPEHFLQTPSNANKSNNPKIAHRRLSVRPPDKPSIPNLLALPNSGGGGCGSGGNTTNILSIPQRRSSLRPSPLASSPTTGVTGRFTVSRRVSTMPGSMFGSFRQTKNIPSWRPTLQHQHSQERRRRSSLTEINDEKYEENVRKKDNE